MNSILTSDLKFAFIDWRTSDLYGRELSWNDVDQFNQILCNKEVF